MNDDAARRPLVPTAFSFLDIRNPVKSAWLGHGPFALWLVEALRPQTIVELGTHNGYSFFCFCQAILDLELNAKVFAVDTWEGDQHAGMYGEGVYLDVKRTVTQQFPNIGQMCRKTFDEARSDFADQSIDILHIDGLHTYDAVRNDYETWRSTVRDGGVILLHDTQVTKADFGVHRFWAEVSAKQPSFEFHHSNGLGVLGVGELFPEPIARLFGFEGTTDAQAVRDQFARLASPLEMALRHQKQLATAELHATRLLSQIETFENSGSWRVTAPLRTVRHHARNAIRQLRNGQSPVPFRRGLKRVWQTVSPAILWDAPDHLFGQVETYQSRSMRRPKAIVYTAIIGGYDRLMLPDIIDPDVDYVCFSDRPRNGHGVWQIRPVPYYHPDATRIARFVKTHPFLLLGDTDQYVWIDGNIRFRGNIKNYLHEDGPPARFLVHPLRGSVKEEIDACLYMKKDQEAPLRRQFMRYEAEGIAGELALFETNFFVVRACAQTRKFMSVWWGQIDQYSRRDQVSVGYALKTTGTDASNLLDKEYSTRNHPDFEYFTHKQLRRSADPKELNALSQVVDPMRLKIEKEPLAIKPIVDVIICVHNALYHVKACIDSVLSDPEGPRRLILVNDMSDDETSKYLNEIRDANENVELIENGRNLGYTTSANVGLMHSDADFRILLNSDTIVARGWVNKLSSLAYSYDAIGIVGPMSNAASYQSLPSIKGGKSQTAINTLPNHATVDQLDKACERWSENYKMAIVPLVHGFCIGIKASVIDTIGCFDDVNFARFYGEENDYCLRANSAGFLLAVSTETFVYHAKSKSISEELRLIHLDEAGRRLREIHSVKKVRIACQQMEYHPVLVEMRQKANSEWESIASD